MDITLNDGMVYKGVTMMLFYKTGRVSILHANGAVTIIDRDKISAVDDSNKE